MLQAGLVFRFSGNAVSNLILGWFCEAAAATPNFPCENNLCAGQWARTVLLRRPAASRREQQSIRNDSQIMMGWNWKQISSVPQMWVAHEHTLYSTCTTQQERTQTQTDDRYDPDRKSQIWRNIKTEYWDSRRHVRSTVINTNAVRVRLSEKWDFTSWDHFLVHGLGGDYCRPWRQKTPQ